MKPMSSSVSLRTPMRIRSWLPTIVPQFIDKRRVMMQNWADFVDSLTNEKKVVYPRFGGTVAAAE
jgi:hypothetical protein